MSTIKDIILRNRPKIALSTAKSYASTINVIGKSIGKPLKSVSDIISNIQNIYNSFSGDISPSIKKNRQTSLLVVLDDGSDKYRDIISHLKKLMIENADKYDEVLSEQKKTQKQKDGWLEWSTVVERYNRLKSEIAPIFKADATLNKSDFFKIQLFVILSCYILIPPRRSEYVHFKIRNFSTEVPPKNNSSTFKGDNYMDGLKFVFNRYKTFNKYGTEKVKIPTILKNIINKWKTINKSDYLIVGSNRMKPIGAAQLNRIFNNFFGKNLGSQLLRHIFISSKFRDGGTYREMKETARDMGHSLQQQQEEYLKV